MNFSTIVFLCVVAALASIAAVAAGGNLGLAIPSATVAVASAALLLVAVLDRTRWPTAAGREPQRSASTHVESAFEAGPTGRLELLALLDSLDRDAGVTPRPPPSATELAALRHAGSDQFRRYLDARIRDLERRT